MRLARFLSRLATAVTAAAVLLTLTPATASADPGQLCSRSDARGKQPTSFGLDVCLDENAIWVHNQLKVPVTLQRSGSVGAPTTVSPDQSIAAIATRAAYRDPMIVMPGDIVRFKLGDGSGKLEVRDTKAGFFYIEAVTLSAFSPGGRGKDLYDGSTSVISDLTEAAFQHETCKKGKNYLQQGACDLVYDAEATKAIANAIATGALRGAAGLILGAVNWSQVVAQQAPSILHLGQNQGTVSISARPQQAPAPTAPTTSQAPSPATGPTSTDAPEPAGPTTAPAASPPEDPSHVQGFTVEDDYLDGTWARTDPGDGTSYSRGNRPANGAYWYPNGLDIGVDCAVDGAAYTVKFGGGRQEMWTTWFHVTDGKWMPSAATQQTTTDGHYGLPTC